MNDRGNSNSNTVNEELILLNDIKDSSSVNDQTLDIKTNNSDSENSIIDNPTEDVYDYYEDYYEAAYDNDQEIRLMDPMSRSNRQWHDCGAKPPTPWNGRDVVCSGTTCAAVCPIGE